jgi:lysophospholipase L1-like esterase
MESISGKGEIMSLRSLRVVLLALAPLVAIPRPSLGGSLTYLALGDSLAFGVGGNDSPTDISDGNRGYVAPFLNALGAQNGGVQPNLIDLAISGETTSSFFSGSGGLDPGAAVRNTNYPTVSPPPQDAQMLSVIQSELNAGHTISTVTLQLGANDLFETAFNPGFSTLTAAQQQNLIMQTFATIQANDTMIIGQIRSLLPNTQLILMGYYDPYAPFYNGDPTNPLTAIAQLTHALTPNLNTLIGLEAQAAGALFVNPYSAFVGNELADTYIATGNVHPNALGYALIANDLIATSVVIADAPEPASVVMLGTAVIAVLGYARRRRAA